MKTQRPNENLASFIERTLLGWSPGLRVYHIDNKTYRCWESDEQWIEHLSEIDKKLSIKMKG